MAVGIYKSGQGKYTRVGTAGLLIVIFGLICMNLMETLESKEFSVWVETLIPAGVFAVLCILSLWLVNRPGVADFMIAGEGEMKKVNWSSRREITISTIVVIIVVTIFAVMFWIADLLFAMFFIWLLGK